MRLINRVSYFSMCLECQRHGHIVCVSGEESREFVTVSGGLEELSDLVLSGEVMEDEAREIRRQIEESGFEIENAQMDEILRRSAQARRELHEIINEVHQELRGVHIRPGKRPTTRIHQKRILH